MTLRQDSCYRTIGLIMLPMVGNVHAVIEMIRATLHSRPLGLIIAHRTMQSRQLTAPETSQAR